MNQFVFDIEDITTKNPLIIMRVVFVRTMRDKNLSVVENMLILFLAVVWYIVEAI